MKRAAVAAVAVPVLAALVGAGPAQAQPVATGSLSFSGDGGDYISQGGSYAYSTEANDRLTVNASEDRNHIAVSVSAFNSDWWTVDLAAPSGTGLTAGTYDAATRYPFQEPDAPGLDLSGNGRGCNTLVGTFTVQNVVFGPRGYVQTLDATFEQHCEGAEPAARGEVHIANPPAPPDLAIGLKVATDGTASTLNGNAYLHGTVDCTAAAKVTLSGAATQVKRNVIIRGTYTAQVACTPGTPAPWTATVVPAGTTPFQKGKAEVVTQATALDPQSNTNVSVDDTTVVTLVKS
ncbi:hypothetical protein [Amycolatopsis rifamycinica]|uniref:Uncharacterized protein n=1 Tax=Amycolatopsis rifamycinica TaxID=287986 RepID=A0A066TZ72_9PSEU|nr:hypothetical protein [Amycolatopsis rifamycinica]KDN20506.1 hypothetical protein DV20_19855 [Amycolatopsis rifamycinica]